MMEATPAAVAPRKLRPTFGMRGALARVRAVAWFRARGVRLGPGARLYGPAPLVAGGRGIAIGERLRLESRQFRTSLAADAGARLEIGDRVFINQGVTIHAASAVTIGDDVMLADLAVVCDTDFHPVTPDVAVRRAPITIGRNSWIGRGAVILPGVSIGENAVVAAGSVVTRSVDPNTVVAGNPARAIRTFDAPTGWKRP